MVKCSKAELRRLKTALRWKNIPPAQRERIQMVLLRESLAEEKALLARFAKALDIGRCVRITQA